eukprot:jgi/Mesvir1/1483/Mv14466-RA.1
MNVKHDPLTNFKKLAKKDTQTTPGGPELTPATSVPDDGATVVSNEKRLAEFEITSKVTSRSSAYWSQDKRLVGAADFMGTDIAMVGDYIAYTKKNDTLVVLRRDTTTGQSLPKEIPAKSIKVMLEPEIFFKRVAPKGVKVVFVRYLGPAAIKVAIIDGKVYAAKTPDTKSK